MAGKPRREELRHTIRVLRRAPGTAGGYGTDAYREAFVTSAGVRDESDREYNQSEAAGVAHTRLFTMRAREVLPDDVIVWHGREHEVRSVDAIQHDGRYVRVRAVETESRHTVVPGDG